MAKRKTEGPGASGEAVATSRLSWEQERFIEYYLENGGNATRAYMQAYNVSYTSALAAGPRLLGNVRVAEALEAARAEDREAVKFDRQKALKILVGMAIATVDDFTEVLKNPESRESYIGLGQRRHALKSARSSFKTGNEIQLYDKKAVVDDLWEKLGLGKEAGGRDRLAALGELLGLAGSLDKKGGTG